MHSVKGIKTEVRICKDHTVCDLERQENWVDILEEKTEKLQTIQVYSEY